MKIIDRKLSTADRCFRVKSRLYIIHQNNLLRADGTKMGNFIYFQSPWPWSNEITHWPRFGWKVVYQNGKPENEILGLVTAVFGEIPAPKLDTKISWTLTPAASAT